MLEKIVELLQENKIYTINEIAQKLNTSAEQVRISLEYLEKIECIKKNPFDKKECSKKCESCKGCFLSVLKNDFTKSNIWQKN